PGTSRGGSMRRQTFAAGLAALILSGASLRAQEAGRFEVGVFGGVVLGSRISFGTLNPQNVGPLALATDPADGDRRLRDGASVGLRGAFRVNPHFTLEAGWMHSTANARTTVPETNSGTGPLLAVTPVTLNAYEVTGLYEFGRGRARGYFGLGAGVMDIDDKG